MCIRVSRDGCLPQLATCIHEVEVQSKGHPCRCLTFLPPPLDPVQRSVSHAHPF